ncbi:DUF2336 domain-containing protein [Leptospira sp. severe_002]|uniref:DUF2336 domain-containing protein n=1 Tax=Leptospira sp. severe_002 TaxID=2838237 RepID=UPI001E549620|nr:DUF2336 domain-containing protein [Leptospira sp. severe_002]
MNQAAAKAPAETLATSQSLIDELIVATGHAKERLRIVQRIADLFVAGSRGYSVEQIDLFDDVLQQLVTDIEVQARAKLAHQMATLENAPPKLIRKLAFDDAIEVAGSVLVNSLQLTDADLVENAQTKSQQHLLAIANRLKLSEAVTDVLVDRGDNKVVRTVARNRGARFSLVGYDKLIVRAKKDEDLTVALGERSDIPRQYFLKLLNNASATVREKLEAANPKMAAAIAEAVDEVATAMQQEAREASREHAGAMKNSNRRFKAHPIAEVNVHAPARAQEFEKTVVALSKLGKFPVDLVERALLDEGEDMILILAKAAGCSWITARELLQMFAAKRNLTPDDLEKSFERYKKLTQETTRAIVKFHEKRLAQRVQEAEEADARKESAVKAFLDKTVEMTVPRPI